MKMINRLKKTGTIFMVLMLVILSMSTISYASPKKYISSEGIGIEVCSPNGVQVREVGAKNIITDPAVSVSGGSLWATWNTSDITFRANYQHGSKTHRSSATNGNAKIERSQWMPKGIIAISPWLSQTLNGNKVWGATE